MITLFIYERFVDFFFYEVNVEKYTSISVYLILYIYSMYYIICEVIDGHKKYYRVEEK